MSEETVDEFCDRMFLRAYRETLDRVFKACKSPIEKLFFEGIAEECTTSFHRYLIHEDFWVPKCDNPGLPQYPDPSPQSLQHVKFLFFSECVFIENQPKVLGHKVDFCVHTHDKAALVECDGFDYHSDKQAFLRDREFDVSVLREFKGTLPVFRFGGSSIHRDKRACGRAVLEYLLPQV